MMDMTNDFVRDVTDAYGDSFYLKLDVFIEKALEMDAGLHEGIDDWEASSSIEKHDQLNYSYHFDVYRKNDGVDDDEICFTFYTGIDVGCELVDYSIDGKSLMNQPRHERVLVDLVPDWSMYPNATDLLKKKVEIVLGHNKEKIMEIYRKQGYDNYVTGGGTIVTDKFYKSELDRFRGMNLHWELVYEDVEVDVTYR